MPEVGFTRAAPRPLWAARQLYLITKEKFISLLCLGVKLTQMLNVSWVGQRHSIYVPRKLVNPLGWQVGAELGRPCHGAEVLRQRSAAHPSNWCAWLYPGVHRGLGCHHVQVGIEVAALNVKTARSRPLDGDAGILSRAPAVDVTPRVFAQ